MTLDLVTAFYAVALIFGLGLAVANLLESWFILRERRKWIEGGDDEAKKSDPAAGAAATKRPV